MQVFSEESATLLLPLFLCVCVCFQKIESGGGRPAQHTTTTTTPQNDERHEQPPELQYCRNLQYCTYCVFLLCSCLAKTTRNLMIRITAAVLDEPRAKLIARDVWFPITELILMVLCGMDSFPRHFILERKTILEEKGCPAAPCKWSNTNCTNWYHKRDTIYGTS